MLIHITPKRNLESIIKYGLIPCYNNRGLTAYHKDKMCVIWLTDNPIYILKEQAGRNWIDENSPIFIKVNCFDLDIKQKLTNCYGVSKACPHEYYCEDPILQNFDYFDYKGE